MPDELVAAPELALVVVLQQLIEVTAITLAAIHPEIVDDSPYRHALAPPAILAGQLIKLGARLAKAATRYRVAVIAALHAPDTDDIPF